MQNLWLERVGPLSGPPREVALLGRECAVLLETARAVPGMFTRGDPRAASGACALRTSSGNIYTGVNVNVSCGIEFCAEHSAMARMLEARETRIEAIVVVWDDGHIFLPCGRCRELLLQVNEANLETQVLLAPLADRPGRCRFVQDEVKNSGRIDAVQVAALPGLVRSGPN